MITVEALGTLPKTKQKKIPIKVSQVYQWGNVLMCEDAVIFLLLFYE